MSKNPWINPASHGGQTKQGQDAYDKSKGIVRTATGRGVPAASKSAATAANWHGTKTDADVGHAHTEAANKASAQAKRSADPGDHAAAASAHTTAANHYEAAGNPKVAQGHRAAATMHDRAADKAAAALTGAKVRSEHGTEGTITKASKTGDVEVHWNGRGGDMSKDKYTASEARGALKRVDAEPHASDLDDGIRKILHEKGITAAHFDHAKQLVMSGKASDALAALAQARKALDKPTKGGEKVLQTGAKGGSFYVTATGRKIYKKQ